MKITWIGHACFLIDAQEAPIITDPFASEIPHSIPKLEADIATVSHDHFDHDAVHRVPRNHALIEATGEPDVRGVAIRGIASLHRPGGSPTSCTSTPWRSCDSLT